MNPTSFRYWLLASALMFGFLTEARADDSLASIFTNVTVHGGTPRRPSIIFIRCHGLGYNDLSCDGQTNFLTPNLDKLAAGGMRFTNFTAGAADFTGSLSALMTGKNGAFAPGTETLAERMRQAGYHTGLIGEWTLGEQPWTQGFDEFAGFITEDEGRDYYADHVWRFAPHSLYDSNTKTISDYAGKEMIFANSGGHKGKYMPEVFVNSVLEFIKDNRPDNFNKHQPFFLLADYPAPRSAAKDADVFSVTSDAPYSDEPWPQPAKNRVALITRIDGDLGRLFEQLAKSAITNNYIIIFSSSAVPEKFADRKLDFLKPNGAVAPDADPATLPLPMIVYGPGLIPADRVSGAAWSNADFLPTALELALQPPVAGLDGVSVLPVFKGQNESVR